MENNKQKILSVEYFLLAKNGFPEILLACHKFHLV